LDLPGIPFRTALVGAGRVGTAVAELLRRAGNTVIGVSSRTRESAEREARRLDVPVMAIEDAPRAEVILLGVPEAALPEMDELLAPRVGPGHVVWHVAGAHGVSALERVATAGASVAALHPVQACPSVDAAIRRLPGSAWGVTCSPGLEGWSAEVVSGQLEGRPVPVPEDLRPLWHAAAVVTSNGVTALMASGERLIGGITDGPEHVLGPLALGTITNAIEGGGGAATLTGPVMRGEVATVQRHLEALRSRDPEMAKIYISTTRMILDVAEQAGRVDEGTAARMRTLLG